MNRLLHSMPFLMHLRCSTVQMALLGHSLSMFSSDVLYGLTRSNVVPDYGRVGVSTSTIPPLVCTSAYIIFQKM
ncbi:hypothetical protein BD311DRAFT_464204 [Dichomitus squalens]|uniref:Secreted protein n=1 Tax=Dichomitus squalens TaxID=114155 RepID=A0A4Q9MF32_9APHY|nr:hypothetical protein BD311DRAFT_464204 [Dichomitus squalens]